MFAESDRVDLRHYLGFSAIFLQADPRLENAITSVQAITDGGTRPDNSTELAIRAIVQSLKTLDANLQNLWVQAQVSNADEVKLDPYRGRAMLCAEGRRLVRGLEVALATKKRADIYASGAANPTGDTFADMLSPQGGKRW